MDDLTLRYFDAEMRYLRDAAKEFARAHPDRAALLDLDKAGTPDPYVERLFEGFAFSMGRLREKIDDDLPELTEGLVSQLWPHYLKTIPSLAIVLLEPELSAMRIGERAPAGMRVYSRPVGPQQTVCEYRTTRAIPLNPLSLTRVTMETEPDGRSRLRLQLQCHPQTDWPRCDLRRLALYLADEVPVSNALHLALTRRMAALYIRFGQNERIRLAGSFTPGGFGDEDALWPSGEAAFSGYQLLLEYFTFREKFRFVHLNGLEELRLPEGIDRFDLEVVLSEQWDGELPVASDALRPPCVPVINLFRVEADPLRVNGLESEYLLRPRRLQDGHTEIYSVDAVHGSKRGSTVHYAPFTSFRHKGGMQRSAAPACYFHTRVRKGPGGLHDTWLILGGDTGEVAEGSDGETLSLSVTGTNGQLPRKALQSTLLDRCEPVTQTALTVRNLGKPTLPAYPPAEDSFHWRVLSHLGSSFLNIMSSAEVLRNTLELYNWQHQEMNLRQLDAIRHVQHHLIQRFEKGYLLRGVDVEVTLDGHGFSGQGEVHLFGEMLNRFLALYSDIHLFNQLTLIVQPENLCIRWKENHNQRLPG